MVVPKALRAAVELVLPRTCGGCGAAGTWWCDPCAHALEPPPQVTLLPRTSTQPELWWACAAPYRGPAGAALVAMKERGVSAVLGPLADALARSVLLAASSVGPAGDLGGLALVPAPSRPAAVRARGADVVAALARACATRLARTHGRDVRVVPALVHTRSVGDQAMLGPADRAANLAGAIRARTLSRSLLGARVVVVVDDVLTTGATAREAARALTVLRPDLPVVAATVAGAGWSVSSDSDGLLVPRAADG